MTVMEYPNNMKRREFLAGAACATMAAACAGGRTARAGENTMQEGRTTNREHVERRNQNRSSVACCNGVVCTSQPLASMAGLSILQAGGNAVDAALCANMMLGVVEPMNCGPGGDLFAMTAGQLRKAMAAIDAYAAKCDQAMQVKH